MSQICDLVPSTKGNPKLVLDGYLLCKDKRRGDLFYWCCEKRKTFHCGGFASTILIDGKHHLRGKRDHNHAPDATRKPVSIAVDGIKKKSRLARDCPAQLIQDEMNAVPVPIQPAMPSRGALRQLIKRARREDMPTQPDSLEEIDIPLALKTINGGNILVKDSSVNNERILLFTCKKNVQYLSEADYWIMDGTFKTVPRLFYQLYSIHAPVGSGDNAKVLPLVYALMTSKSEECYTRLLEDLSDFAVEKGHVLTPKFIITDFEKASINASEKEFPNASSRGCFFHLGQSIWRHIQSAGLATRYGEDEDFSLKLRHIAALAFLPPADIPSAFDELKPLFPNEAMPVIQWFEETYVHGKIRRTTGTGSTVRSPPLFPPEFWTVHERSNLGIPRTQNQVEAWHRRFETLVGSSHVGVYTLIKEINKEFLQVLRRAEDIVRGKPLSPTRRLYVDRENRLSTVMADRTNRTTIDFLRGIAHNIAF